MCPLNKKSKRPVNPNTPTKNRHIQHVQGEGEMELRFGDPRISLAKAVVGLTEFWICFVSLNNSGGLWQKQIH